MRDKRVSVRGNLIRDMIHDIMETSLKEPIQTEHCVMEYLRPEHVMTGRVILQLHGGSYIGPMKNIYRKFAVRYSRLSYGGDVLSVDYRVAPEDPYPAALNDAIYAYYWLIKEKKYQPEQIVIAGDSAGGGLALALCMYLRDYKVPMPGGLIMMSPWTDLTCSGESYDSNYEKDPLFGKSRESTLYHSPYIGEMDPHTPYISPLFGTYQDLPPMLFQVGDYEMLLSDTLQAAQKAKKAGVKCRASIYEGMFHAFQMSMDLFPESKEAWEEIQRYFEVIYKIERKPAGKIVRKVKRKKTQEIWDRIRSQYEDYVDYSREVEGKVLSGSSCRISKKIKSLL